MLARCRFRCASKVETRGGRWLIGLQAVYPPLLPLDAIPTGPRPTGRDEITPQAIFELETRDPAPWQVGAEYDMTIRPMNEETQP
ncbi:MAG: hypothetical protein NTAFB01_13430 [Nitrospira sp.]